jgi:hypothetical protein
MAGTKIFARKIGQLTLAENRLDSFNLKVKPNLIKRLQLLLSLNVTVGGGGGVSIQDNPMGFISNIQVKTSEGQALKSISGINAYYKCKYEVNTAPHKVVLSGSPTANTYDIFAVIPISFDWLTSATPEATILNANAYNEISLYIQTSNVLATICSNAVLNTATLDIISHDREPIDTDDQTSTRPENRESEDSRIVVGASDQFDFDIPADTIVGKLFIKVIDNGLRSNTLVTNVMVTGNNGNFVPVDIPFTVLQSDNKELYSLETIEDGIVIVDFDPDGGLDDMFNTLQISTPKLRLKVGSPTGVARVEVLFQKLVA